MKVTLETKTDSDPLSIEVRCHETWTAVAHIDVAIDTLKAARAWMVSKQPKADKPK